MSLYRRLIKGTIYNLIASVSGQGSTFAVSILIARILSQEEYGQYTILLATLLSVAMISQLSTGYTAQKFVAQYRTASMQRVGQIIGACTAICYVSAIVSGAVFFLAAPYIAGNVLNAPQNSTAVAAGVIFVVFTSINSLQTGILSGLEAFDRIARASAICGILTIIFVPLAASYGGLLAVVTALGVLAFVRWALLNAELQYARRMLNGRPPFMACLMREKTVIFDFTLPACLVGLYSSSLVWYASVMLVWQPDGHREMALYGAANTLRVLVLFLPGVITPVIMTLLTNLIGEGELKRHSRFAVSSTLSIFVICSVSAALFGAFGHLLLRLFGPDFAQAYPTLMILLVSSVFEGVFCSLYQKNVSQSLMWPSFLYIILPRDLALVLLARVLIGPFGSSGLAAASLATNIMGILLITAVSYRSAAGWSAQARHPSSSL